MKFSLKAFFFLQKSMDAKNAFRLENMTTIKRKADVLRPSTLFEPKFRRSIGRNNERNEKNSIHSNINGSPIFMFKFNSIIHDCNLQKTQEKLRSNGNEFDLTIKHYSKYKSFLSLLFLCVFMTLFVLTSSSALAGVSTAVFPDYCFINMLDNL